MLATLRLASLLLILGTALLPARSSEADTRHFVDPSWPELRPWLDGLSSWDPEVEHVQAFLQPWRTGLSRADSWSLARLVVAEASRVGLDAELVLAVIQVESSGRPTVVSHAGAIGLMQLLPNTARAQARRLGIEWRGEETLRDPFDNVRMGIDYLARLERRFGDLEIALAAYNAGPTRIARQLRSKRELPQAYARKVLATVAPVRA